MAMSVIAKLNAVICKLDDAASSAKQQIDIQTHRVVINKEKPEDSTDDVKTENKSDSQQDAPRITELPNEMSWNIDISSPMEILRILRVCDSQIFSGWHEFANIYDFIPIINIIVRHLADILSDTQHNKVILSGSGTSGRLAFVISRAFNEYLLQHNYSACFDYCLSGYDIALLTSQELYEDDPANGVRDLLQRTQNAKKVLLIGITCGLSAPYVGGQIEYAMTQSNYVTVLMGFNPAHLSRDRPVEKWNGKTFRDICMRLNGNTPKPADFRSNLQDENHRHYQHLATQILLNPIFGPETITGSTRMKSGSGTKILLDVMFLIAFYEIHRADAAKQNSSNRQLNGMIYDLLSEYENIYRQSYSYTHLNELATICNLAGNTLQSSHGRVIYYGAAQATSIVSFIDASEMKPTYGTVLKRYRSYFEGGWKYLQNKQGDLSHIDERFQVEPKYLDICSLTEHDLVVFIGNVSIPKEFEKAACKFARISVGNDKLESLPKVGDAVSVEMKVRSVMSVRNKVAANCSGLLSTFDDFCNMFAMKLLLNAVSTAGHVLSGTVLHNRMINVRVSNDKLFYRSIGMVQEFGKVDFDVARQCLLMSIYGESQWKAKENEAVSKHLIAARDVNKIVPVAILLASQISQGVQQRYSIQEIREILRNEPSVRKVLKSFCK